MKRSRPKKDTCLLPSVWTQPCFCVLTSPASGLEFNKHSVVWTNQRGSLGGPLSTQPTMLQVPCSTGRLWLRTLDAPRRCPCDAREPTTTSVGHSVPFVSRNAFNHGLRMIRYVVFFEHTRMEGGRIQLKGPLAPSPQIGHLYGEQLQKWYCWWAKFPRVFLQNQPAKQEPQLLP